MNRKVAKAKGPYLTINRPGKGFAFILFAIGNCTPCDCVVEMLACQKLINNNHFVIYLYVLFLNCI